MLQNKPHVSYIYGKNLIFDFSFRFLNLWLSLSRDLSTDKQNKSFRGLNNFTLRDKSQKTKIFNHNCENGPQFKILTFRQFPDLPISFW